MLDRNKDCDLFGPSKRKCGCGFICHCKTVINKDGTLTLIPNERTRARNRLRASRRWEYRGLTND